ncbi:hypothetical protein BU16DRAFT_531259 [Lophium mytilinum]|uniref:Uncharacterized protein n=1 Tax=Lophium mytilinum TaxID=390894 RepID=A0A6A6QCJ2_9PEZI|nr:hypothetical protein BU16DRAFT_531259 [Lophium mytilinum]
MGRHLGCASSLIATFPRMPSSQVLSITVINCMVLRFFASMFFHVAQEKAFHAHLATRSDVLVPTNRLLIAAPRESAPPGEGLVVNPSAFSTCSGSNYVSGK